MTSGIESPFAVRAPGDVNTSPTAVRLRPATGNPLFGTFRFSMMLTLAKATTDKVVDIIGGIEDEDLSVNEDGTYDDEFDSATIEALEEAELEIVRSLESIRRFKGLVEGRFQQMSKTA